jgi:hypothetical protein
MALHVNKRAVLQSCLAFLMVIAGSGASAQTHQNDRQGAEQKPKTLVGSWWTDVQPTVMPPFLGLGTFTADGGVINTTSLSLASPLESPGHGQWIQTGPRTFAITFFTLNADSAGTVLWTSKVRATVKLSTSGDEFTGTFRVDVFAPDGSPIGSDTGTVHSTRIKVEPL